MQQDYIRNYMNNHIDILHNFFISYANNLINQNLSDVINSKSISIDFSSNSRQGDISSNFYLIAISWEGQFVGGCRYDTLGGPKTAADQRNLPRTALSLQTQPWMRCDDDTRYICLKLNVFN